MADCLDAIAAEAVVRGKVPEAHYDRAIQHAARCAACRRLLYESARPEVELEPALIHEIQERVRGWCAARRSPRVLASLLATGQIVGRYVIVRAVGPTEDGYVYEAVDPDVEQRVALKHLDLDADDPAASDLGARLARLRAVAHPNVLPVFAVGAQGGRMFVAHPLVKGYSLSRVEDRDPRRVIDRFAQAGRGLAAAHAAQVTHGCFGPSSCVLGRDGGVRVLDFGIAEAFAIRRDPHGEPAPTAVVNDFASPEDSFIGYIPQALRQTHPGHDLILSAATSVLGPWVYAAPERLRNGASSPAADQFALCAALFHQLYGALPFAGDTIATWVRSVLRGRIATRAANPDVSPRVHAAICRGLHPDPAARFADIGDLVAELGPPRWSRARRAVAVGAVAGVAGASIAALVFARATAVDHHAPITCAAEIASAWTTTWPAARADAVDSPAAPTGKLRTRIDDRVTAWRTAGSLCRLEPVVRDGCVARARDAVVDLAGLVSSHGDQVAALAQAATDAVPAPEDCGRIGPTGMAGWPSVAIAAELRRRLGLLDDAEQTAERVTAPSSTLVQGLVAADRGDLVTARDRLEAAAFAAQGAGETGVMLAAAIQRLHLACTTSDRTVWKGYADAQARLAGAGAEVQRAIDAAQAASLACEGLDADAVAIDRRLVHELPVGTVASAEVELALARALLASGDADGAAASAAHARDVFRDVNGANHPTTLTATLVEADAAVDRRELGQAEQLVGEVRAAAPPAAVSAAATLVNARILRARGWTADAIAEANTAIASYDAALGGAYPDMAAALLEAGELLLEADRDVEAETAFRQAGAILEVAGHTESRRMQQARVGAAVAQLDRPPAPDVLDAVRGRCSINGDLDPRVDAWLADQLAGRAARAGQRDHARELYAEATSAAAVAGDPRLSATVAARAALFAGDRDQLASALELADTLAIAERPQLQAALARLEWKTDPEHARALADAAAAELSVGDAEELARWRRRADHHASR